MSKLLLCICGALTALPMLHLNARADEECGCRGALRLSYQPLQFNPVLNQTGDGFETQFEMNLPGDNKHFLHKCQCSVEDETCSISSIELKPFGEGPDIRWSDGEMPNPPEFNCIWAVAATPEIGDHWLCESVTCEFN